MAKAEDKPGNWSYGHTLAAFNLYCRTPFGKLHARNPEIIRLGREIGRTANAVAMKCCNLASLDPSLQARGIKGLSKVSKLDHDVWGSFHEDPERIGYESALAFSQIMSSQPPMLSACDATRLFHITEKSAVRRVRVTQHLFRKMILASYGGSCSICGLSVPKLLVASHIVSWADDEENRMNPRNGICLCAIHDRAFDAKLLNLSEDFSVEISDRIDAVKDDKAAQEMLLRYDGRKLRLPERWLPDPALLIKRRALLDMSA